MKILYVTVEDMNLSKGSAVHVREIVRRLREMDCEVTLVASGSPQQAEAGGSGRSGKRRHCGGRIRRMTRILWGLIRVFLHANRGLLSHDLVYARDYHVALACTLARTIFRKPLIYEINGIPSEEWLMKGDTILRRVMARVIRELERLAARHADSIVTVTHGLRAYLVSRFGVEPMKISVIPNGVDTMVFHPMHDTGSRERLRTRIGIQKDNPLVLFVGNLAPWQGVSTLLDSIPLVRSQVPRARFVIVGEGALRPDLERQTRRMNLEKHVSFTGMISHDQVPHYIHIADVCVSPFVTRRNNRIGLSPLKIYEYMACGKAVVSSRIAGLDFIEETGSGILVDPEDPEDLARGIAMVLLNPERRAAMGRNGARVALQECDWRKRAREILEIATDQTQRLSPSRVFP